ncbi:hypothetical protein V6N12_040995 [Hibiscus sabdariffa]|uniref:Uncharacterized protein n=1 Tax=Hibiscus sabdariffa TaxID=183260 RepID=A0ABR2E776_9ROSI
MALESKHIVTVSQTLALETENRASIHDWNSYLQMYGNMSEMHSNDCRKNYRYRAAISVRDVNDSEDKQLVRRILGASLQQCVGKISDMQLLLFTLK